MSKPIKFRVWDEYGLLYICPLTIIEKITKYDEEHMVLMDFCYDDRWTVEQYTGIKDRNDKEIYEGDIIKVVHVHDGDEECWEQPYGPAIPQEVKWDERRLRWSFGGCGRILYDPEDFEIIGNIHENPELLGGKE